MKEMTGLIKLFFKMELRNKSFLIPSFIFPLCMLLLMSVAGREDGAYKDISYASFLTPGILCMAYAAIAFVAFPVMIASYRERGILRNFKTSALPVWKIILSIIITQMAFMILQTIFLLFFAIIVLKAKFNLYEHSWMCIPVTIIGIFSMLSLGFLLSARVENARVATMIGNFANLVCIFLGGVFFPVDTWPDFMRPLTRIDPIAWIADVVRKSILYMHADMSLLARSSAVLGGIALISVFAGLKLFRYE